MCLGLRRALERIAAIDYGVPGATPLEFRLRNAVAIATAALDDRAADYGLYWALRARGMPAAEALRLARAAGPVPA